MTSEFPNDYEWPHVTFFRLGLHHKSTPVTKTESYILRTDCITLSCVTATKMMAKGHRDSLKIFLNLKAYRNTVEYYGKATHLIISFEVKNEKDINIIEKYQQLESHNPFPVAGWGLRPGSLSHLTEFFFKGRRHLDIEKQRFPLDHLIPSHQIKYLEITRSALADFFFLL